ncbi:MAG: hypothetical protein K9M81_00585 [Chthoniobacterales bacterium]|nr:hypothetical protein [Chthoniobacterales bacterium]
MAEILLNDSFGKAIYSTIRDYKFTSCLEIGSFNGDGSTQVLIAALSRASNPKLVCLESNPERFKKLIRNTKDYPWVKNICDSTISLASLTISDFDHDIWQSCFNKLQFSYEQVSSWWKQDIEFLKNIESGYLESNDESFDVCLIDGGEFCAYDEFRIVKDRVQCLMLDDVFRAFKNNRVHRELLEDKEWKLIYEDPTIRNGASIFVRNHLKPVLRVGRIIKNFLTSY